MKKILLLFVLFFNLIPNIRDDGFSFLLTGSYAQSFGDEDDPYEVCENTYTQYVGTEGCNEVYFEITESYYCADGEYIDQTGTDIYEPIADCGEDDDDNWPPEEVDCAGVVNGSAHMAECGCIGGNTGIYECPPEEEDCNGDPGGSAYLADCGCIGGNTGIYECPPLDTWYLDNDGDGWGNSAVTQVAYSSPGIGWKLQGGDYNDNCYNVANDTGQCQPVCNANTNVSIIWGLANYSTNMGTSNSSTRPTPLIATYMACADLSAKVWRLRVQSISGNATIVVATGGSRDPIMSPPINQTEAIDAINVMNAYFTNGGRGSWHTESASKAHEEYHYSQIKCATERYWLQTEACIETLTVPILDFPNATSAITAMQSQALAMIYDMQNEVMNYCVSLGDGSGDAPYAAGQLVLNDAVNFVKNLAVTNSWTVPTASTTPTVPSLPCFGSFITLPCP